MSDSRLEVRLLAPVYKIYTESAVNSSSKYSHDMKEYKRLQSQHHFHVSSDFTPIPWNTYQESTFILQGEPIARLEAINEIRKCRMHQFITIAKMLDKSVIDK